MQIAVFIAAWASVLIRLSSSGKLSGREIKTSALENRGSLAQFQPQSPVAS